MLVVYSGDFWHGFYCFNSRAIVLYKEALFGNSFDVMNVYHGLSSFGRHEYGFVYYHVNLNGHGERLPNMVGTEKIEQFHVVWLVP